MTTAEQRAQALAYYYAHRDAINERRREKYRTDEDYREDKKRRAKEWAQANPNQVEWNRKAYYEKNRDRLLKEMREYYLAHREQINAYNREYYKRRRKANA